MSRIGRSPIEVPSGVEVTLRDGSVAVSGPQGTLQRDLPGSITVRRSDASAARRAARRPAGQQGSARPDPEPHPEHGDRRHGRVHQGARDRRRRLPGDAEEPAAARAGARVQPPGLRRRARGHLLRGADPAAHHREGHRQGGGRPGRRRHPQGPQARALQGQGRAGTRAKSCSARPGRRRSSHEQDTAHPRAARSGVTVASASR